MNYKKPYKIRLNTKKAVHNKIKQKKTRKSESERAGEGALKNPSDSWHIDFAWKTDPSLLVSGYDQPSK